MIKNKLRRIIIASMIGLASIIPFKQVQAKVGGYGKFAGYYDNRDKPTATFTCGAYGLPLGSEFFGFVEMETEKDNLDNLKRPYTEACLSRKAKNGFGIAVEHDKDFVPLPSGITLPGVTRLGGMYEFKNKSNELFGCKFYPAATQNNGMQVVLYGNKKFNKEDIVVDGFLDYNFKPGKIVTELQVGKRVKDTLYGVVEGRYSGFKAKEKTGVAAGLEWKF